MRQNNGHYVIQGHSGSLGVVPIASSCATSYLPITVTYLLSCTISETWRIIGRIFAVDREVPVFDAFVGSKSLSSGLRNLASRN